MCKALCIVLILALLYSSCVFAQDNPGGQVQNSFNILYILIGLGLLFGLIFLLIPSNPQLKLNRGIP